MIGKKDKDRLPSLAKERSEDGWGMGIFPPVGVKEWAEGRFVEVTGFVINCLTLALSLLHLINGVLLTVRIHFFNAGFIQLRVYINEKLE